jgi:hypothetical protein
MTPRPTSSSFTAPPKVLHRTRDLLAQILGRCIALSLQPRQFALTSVLCVEC